jgi:predicted RNA binding protein YcfA (HicA-like mRNA interferase family)
MTILRLVCYRELKKVVQAAGFQWIRCEGSHNVFRHDSGKIVMIPDHGTHVIVRPLANQNVATLSPFGHYLRPRPSQAPEKFLAFMELL